MGSHILKRKGGREGEMEGATEKWNQWEPTEMDDRKKDGGGPHKEKRIWIAWV